jgi:hypothetical protein
VKSSKWVKRGGKASRVKADGEIRRSQAIRTYGAGSLMDLVDRSVLIGGLDFWSFGTEGATAIVEPRLRDTVASMLVRLDEAAELSLDKAFLLPPAGLEGEPQHNNGVEVLEFPQWFVCQDPRCRALVRAPQGLELKGERWQHYCDAGKYSPAVPVRFVMACKNGHLDEVPWIFFTHEAAGRPRCASPRLRLIEGKTGDFSEVQVGCVCGPPRALANLLAPEGNPQCQGHRPWLGPAAQEPCDQRPRLLMRGASNAYFPQVVSALTIPETDSALVEIVRGLMDVLINAGPANLATLRQVIPKLAALGRASDAEVLDAVERVKNPDASERLPLRTAEFLQLTSQPDYKVGVLPAPDERFFARRYRPAAGLPDGLSRIVLAPRLREVSVQVGFTRLEAPTADLQGEYDLGVTTCRLGLNTSWLPASEIRGEGVFLQLDEDAVRAWEDRPAVRERARVLLAGHEEWARGRDTPPPFLGVRFYLLHSLSHLLMNAIAVECGYSAAALSERIYCAPRNDEVPMAAILISTGTPGTEGTLGGLVEQGKQLLEHLQRAYDMGRLCSNDPVCAYHTPAADPTRRHREGAACHGCLYVAEPSCERFNCYLDRALVVPTMGHPAALPFFSERPRATPGA